MYERYNTEMFTLNSPRNRPNFCFPSISVYTHARVLKGSEPGRPVENSSMGVWAENICKWAGSGQASGFLFYKTHFKDHISCRLWIVYGLLWIIAVQVWWRVSLAAASWGGADADLMLLCKVTITNVWGKKCGHSGGRVWAGFGQTVHAGVSSYVGFRLKNLRAGLGRVIIFRPVENSNPCQQKAPSLHV